VYGVVPFRFPHLESPFNRHPFITSPFPFTSTDAPIIPFNPDSPVPYSCKSASSTVTVFNRIYISPSFHISFILISQFFSSFDRSSCPYLIVRRSFTLTVRRLCVQFLTLILYLCIVSRSGSAARHHTFFLNASIYDVSSFLPLPPHQQFPYNVYMYQRYSAFTYPCTSCSYTVCNTVL